LSEERREKRETKAKGEEQEREIKKEEGSERRRR